MLLLTLATLLVFFIAARIIFFVIKTVKKTLKLLFKTMIFIRHLRCIHLVVLRICILLCRFGLWLNLWVCCAITWQL